MDQQNKLDEHSLAYELLVEVKQSAKRWFVAFLFMIVLELLTIAGFMWYISLPAEEESLITQEADNNSFNNIGNGEINNGSKADLP